ncbi:hypothetical protein VCSRO132_1188 [Vibrio cholerae]|nr:putative membrane protein [Vibrio cholerae]CAH0528078.1 hypothetical protein CTH30272_01748 [Catenococcus thiocycli]KFE08915.1 putative membrane protein [Vibrio cholerae]BCK19934.1 hypothetical protein VCSRO51_0258 [Vibrio cholerae]GHW19205.1 hypothetical protein VCSRO150_0159 [Vibrio cholerae]
MNNELYLWVWLLGLIATIACVGVVFWLSSRFK